MATTIPDLAPAELRERLEELRQLAEEAVITKGHLRDKAAELALHDWQTARYANAISGELRGVYELLVDNPDAIDPDDLLERLEDTISVLDLAIRSDEEVGRDGD